MSLQRTPAWGETRFPSIKYSTVLVITSGLPSCGLLPCRRGDRTPQGGLPRSVLCFHREIFVAMEINLATLFYGILRRAHMSSAEVSACSLFPGSCSRSGQTDSDWGVLCVAVKPRSRGVPRNLPRSGVLAISRQGRVSLASKRSLLDNANNLFGQRLASR